MTLSTELIVESLASFGAAALPTTGADHRFARVQLLSRNFTGDLPRDVLYVTELKVLRRIPKAQLRECCFVFQASPEEAARLSQCRNGIIYPAEYSLGDVTNHLLSLFERMNTLEYKMRLAVRSRSGYEPMMSVVRQMLPGATVVVVDSAYNIITASKDGDTGNSYVDRLLQQGYYDKASLQKMAQYGYFKAGDRFLRPILSSPPNICGDPVILRSYHSNNMFFSFAGCYFPGRMPSLEEQELFRCFTENLDDFFKDTDFYSHSVPKQQQMIADLLQEGNISPEMISDRAAWLHLPEHADFRLGCAEFENGNSINSSHLTLQLRAWGNVPNYGAFQYKDKVLILLQDWHGGTVADQLVFQEHWDEMLELIEQNGAHLGVSLPFPGLDKLRMAYDQANSALLIGLRLHPEERVYHYSKYYLYDMLQFYTGKFAFSDFSIRYLDKLLDDKGTGSSNLSILYHYLMTERNISLTAKRGHMHRNSIIYRLQKIQDALELDLDDPDVRLRLMICFKMLELENKLVIEPEAEYEDPDERQSQYALPE